jgi:hypothetical protein
MEELPFDILDEHFLDVENKVVVVWKGGDEYGTPEVVSLRGEAKDVCEYMCKRCNLCEAFGGELPVNWYGNEFRTFECYPPEDCMLMCDELEEEEDDGLAGNIGYDGLL